MSFVTDNGMKGWQRQCAHTQREKLIATLRDPNVFGIEAIGPICEAMDECSGRMSPTIGGLEYLGHVFDVDNGKVAVLVRVESVRGGEKPVRVELYKRGNVLGNSLRALVAEIDRRINAAATCPPD